MKNLDAEEIVMSSFDYYRICKNVIDSRVRNFPFLNSNSVIVQAKAKSYETPAPVAIFIFEKWIIYIMLIIYGILIGMTLILIYPK